MCPAEDALICGRFHLSLSLSLSLCVCRMLPSKSLLMLILPDGFNFNADPDPVLTLHDQGTFGGVRVLGKTTTSPVCNFEECAGIYQSPCPSSPLYTCTTLVLEKNNANDWPAGTRFQLILQRLDLRPSAGNFGSLLLTTITKSQGKSILLDVGEVTLPMKSGDDLKMSQFNFAPMRSASQISLEASFTVHHSELSLNDGIEISFPPEFILSATQTTAIHLASGKSYNVDTSAVPITYLNGGQLQRARRRDAGPQGWQTRACSAGYRRRRQPQTCAGCPCRRTTCRCP